MADDLTARIVDLVAKALAEREARAARAGARARPRPPPAPGRRHRRPRRDARGRAARRRRRRRAAGAGRRDRDRPGPRGGRVAGRHDPRRRQPAPSRTGPCPPGRGARRRSRTPPARPDDCTRRRRKEPAVYSRDARDVAGSTAEMIARLDAFTELVWRSEPQRGAPPAPALAPADGPACPASSTPASTSSGSARRCRRCATRRRPAASTCAVLNELLGTLCARHAGRLSKWYLVDSLELLGDVAALPRGGPAAPATTSSASCARPDASPSTASRRGSTA